MKVILSPTCKSLTGSLGRGFGYFIVRRKNGFFGVRSRHNVPPDGHWRFILACAELAKMKLHVTDISVSRNELGAALYEARCFIAMQHLHLDHYNAADIINLKITFGL